jgi:hypothetical protein
MGFSLSWVGLQSVDRSAALEALALRDTGEPDEYFETDFAAAEFPARWLVVVSNDAGFFLQPDVMAMLSRGARLVAVCAEEHVMFSSAEEWRDGERIWAAEHVGENGEVDDLTERGSPPARLEEIRASIRKKQEGRKDVDYGFEIPLELAKEIVGFKHDEFEPDIIKFRRLEKA